MGRTSTTYTIHVSTLENTKLGILMHFEELKLKSGCSFYDKNLNTIQVVSDRCRKELCWVVFYLIGCEKCTKLKFVICSHPNSFEIHFDYWC